MLRVLVALLLLCGLALSSGCFSRSTESVYKGTASSRDRGKNFGVVDGGETGGKEKKKSGSLKPD